MSAPLKAALLAATAAYTPGRAVTKNEDEAVKAAAAALEACVPAPDLRADAMALDGVWLCVFDTRDLLFATGDMARMTNNALPAQIIPIRTTFQELRPAAGFYRNTMVMEAGEARLTFLYQSTATFAIAPDAGNRLQVSFVSTALVPACARTSPQMLREALRAPPSMPLSWTTPPIGPFPSTVSYLDEDLRINRGADYISVLRRLG